MSDAFRGLRLHNTLTRSKEDFVPIDASNVRMYVCGPTVYDYAHIGNARPAIVFDVLYRLLRHLYGEDHVTYVRNITDVDDKINARALRDHGGDIASGKLSLNEAIRKVTEPTYDQYQKDVAALGCLPPTHQPRATEHIDGMIAMAQTLLDNENAYLAEGGEGREVLFDVASMPAYGRLSNRRLEDQQAGARIEVKDHKKNPGDFVLWKESSASEPGWPARFHAAGDHADIFGRPGWHLECSVMSEAYLGREFDIHGGGLDLIFPHHENEIAQSCCAHGTERMARYWMHNGFLQVEGRKMSKSEGNFVTIHELLETEKFGGQSWPGYVLRLAMLMTHYREPIDFSVRRLEEAFRDLREMCVNASRVFESQGWIRDYRFSEDFDAEIPPVSSEIVHGLCDDLNFSRVIAHLRELRVEIAIDNRNSALQLFSDIRFLGLIDSDTFIRAVFALDVSLDVTAKHRKELNSLRSLSMNGNDELADAAAHRLRASGLSVAKIFAGGWCIRATHLSEDELSERIAQRLAFIREKNWPEADRIREELLAQGIQLKDGKDPVTGERVTTWEVKR